MSPGPSEVDKALIQKLEVQNFQNASDNSQRLQQKLVNEKKHEIDQRNKAEEQNRKNKFRVSFIFFSPRSSILQIFFLKYMSSKSRKTNKLRGSHSVFKYS